MFTYFDDYNTPTIPSWLVSGHHIYVIESPEHTGMQDNKVFLNRVICVFENTRTFTYQFDHGFPIYTASLDDIGESVFEMRSEAEDKLKKIKKAKKEKKL